MLQKYFNVLKRSTLLLIPFGLFSCTTPQDRLDQKQQSAESRASNFNAATDTLTELTPEQETAFDALNSIQMQIHGQHLYSTFAGIHHGCSTPDSSFVLSRTELQIAIEKLLKKYCTGISIEQRTKLAAEAVLAQEEYVVLQCNVYSTGLIGNGVRNVHGSGLWILPEVLGRRDVILKW